MRDIPAHDGEHDGASRILGDAARHDCGLGLAHDRCAVLAVGFALELLGRDPLFLGDPLAVLLGDTRAFIIREALQLGDAIALRLELGLVRSLDALPLDLRVALGLLARPLFGLALHLGEVVLFLLIALALGFGIALGLGGAFTLGGGFGFGGFSGEALLFGGLPALVLQGLKACELLGHHRSLGGGDLGFAKPTGENP